MVMGSFQIGSLPIHSICLYTDCALVKRHLKIKLAPGINECNLEGLSKLADEKLVNFDGIGSGAIIESVQFMEEEEGEAEGKKTMEIGDELAILRANEIKLKTQLDLNAKMGERLLKILEKQMPNEQNFLLFDEATQNSIDKNFEYCEKKAAELLEKRMGMEMEMKGVEKKIKSVVANKPGSVVPGKKRKIQITLNAHRAVEANIEISYQIKQASWTPSYEFHLVKMEWDENRPKLSVVCHGNVHQNTGEDWKGAKLMLSTGTCSAQSSMVGVEMPKIGMLKAEFAEINHQAAYRSPFLDVNQHLTPMSHFAPLFGASSTARQQESNPPPQQQAEQENEDDWEPLDECLRRPVAAVRENAFATTFAIKNPITILSGPSSNTKLNIASMEMDCLLLYECIPSKQANVFLKAKVVNTAGHPLCAGTYTIRMDDGTTTAMQNLKLEAIGTGEEFFLPIGIYTGAKIEYGMRHKYAKKKHAVFDNSMAKINYAHQIQVKNLKFSPLLVTIYQPLPKSTDERIKLCMIAPEIGKIKTIEADENTSTDEAPPSTKLETPKVGIWMDGDKHRLEWTLELGNKEDKKLQIQYELEYPADKRIRIVPN